MKTRCRSYRCFGTQCKLIVTKESRKTRIDRKRNEKWAFMDKVSCAGATPGFPKKHCLVIYTGSLRARGLEEDGKDLVKYDRMARSELGKDGKDLDRYESSKEELMEKNKDEDRDGKN
ncbi:hypothetical protein STEG23_003001 [Scotinomys teguina]